MRVLVTGGAGFIGIHVTKSLLRYNHKVAIFDNLSNSTKEKITALKRKGAEVILGDVTNYSHLSKAVARCDLVIHLAAKTSVAESIQSPELFHAVNVTGTLNLLRACLGNKVKNVITASSSAVYGNQQRLPLHEKCRPMPISPYGATKMAMENYVQAFSNSYSMNAISLRFFNVYGWSQSKEYAGVIERFLSRIGKNRPPVVYGEGKNTRDFVFIDDVVEAIGLAMSRIEGKKGNVYNIATGRAVSINCLARTMISLSGKKTGIVHKRPRKGDIDHSRASTSLAKRDLGFVSRFSLTEGLDRLMHAP